MMSLSVCAGVFFCVLSLLAAVVLGLFDRRAAKILRRDEAKTGMVQMSREYA